MRTSPSQMLMTQREMKQGPHGSWATGRPGGPGCGGILGDPGGRQPGQDRWFSPGTRRGYGTTELTEVPQLAKPSLVPPQVPIVRVKAGPVQFGNWMYSLAKKIWSPDPGRKIASL
jgi:hypothetical protein